MKQVEEVPTIRGIGFFYSFFYSFLIAQAEQ